MTTNQATSKLTTLVNERLRLKAELDALTEQLNAFDALVISEFKTAGVTKVETENGRVNLIEASTVKWNEEVLQEILTTAQWNRVTVRKVDKARLEAEIMVGRIDSTHVDIAKTIKESKPYLR